MLSDGQLPLDGFGEPDEIELWFDMKPVAKGTGSVFVLNRKSFIKAKEQVQSCLVINNKRYMRKVRPTLSAFQLSGVLLRIYDLIYKPPMSSLFPHKGTQEYQKHLAWEARSKYKGPVLEGPVQISAQFYFVPAVSWPNRKREAALSGAMKHTAKPDLSNLFKALEDGLTGIIWKDDSQITNYYGDCYKTYSTTPGVRLRVRW